MVPFLSFSFPSIGFGAAPGGCCFLRENRGEDGDGLCGGSWRTIPDASACVVFELVCACLCMWWGVLLGVYQCTFAFKSGNVRIFARAPVLEELFSGAGTLFWGSFGGGVQSLAQREKEENGRVDGVERLMLLQVWKTFLSVK